MELNVLGDNFIFFFLFWFLFCLRINWRLKECGCERVGFFGQRLPTLTDGIKTSNSLSLPHYLPVSMCTELERDSERMGKRVSACVCCMCVECVCVECVRDEQRAYRREKSSFLL